jgi:hypothetical protein
VEETGVTLSYKVVSRSRPWLPPYINEIDKNKI